jgi:DNA recombination protein RmuC
MEIALALIAGLALGALAVRLLTDRGPAAPVDDRQISELRDRLDGLAEAQVGAAGEFRGLLGSIAQTQQTVVQSTGELSTALRRPGVRGRWGEVTLQNVCEAAGLSKHVDFDTQVHLRGQGDQAGARPDLVVRLPDEGALPVDAKVPLDGYLDAAEAEGEREREAALERHLAHMRAKVRELGSRAYHERFRRAPEMVVMFVASEAAFSAAVERDPNLLLEAADKKVVIATPATMVALLQVTALGWREAAYAEGTQRVRVLATQLVERLGVLIRHHNKMTRSLESTVQAHNEGARSIESRLLVTARELGRHGIARAEKLERPEQVESPVRPALEDAPARLPGSEAA